MKKEIYVVIESNPNGHEIKGYFSDKTNADRYCIKYSEPNFYLYVKVVSCYDDIEDLSDVNLKYKYLIKFEENENGSWDIVGNPQEFEVYSSNYLKNNSILYCGIGNNNAPRIVEMFINVENNDIKFAKEIARDLLSSFLYMCNDQLPEIAVIHMNTLLSACKDERKKQEEALKQKELAELKRLKEKYETG